MLVLVLGLVLGLVLVPVVLLVALELELVVLAPVLVFARLWLQIYYTIQCLWYYRVDSCNGGGTIELVVVVVSSWYYRAGTSC